MPDTQHVVAGINRLASQATGIDELADSCMAYFKMYYTLLFGNILEKDSAIFNSRIMNGQPNVVLGNLCLMGIEGGKPRLINFTVYMNKGIKHPVVISFGNREQSYAATYSQRVKKGKVIGNAGLNRIGWIKRQVAFGSGRYPEREQEPIDILILTKKGGVWSRQ